MSTLDHQSVGTAYAKLSSCYDFLFRKIFDGGRRRLFDGLPAGKPLRILEVGVGTGLSFPCYSARWHVIGVDYSAAMLAKAVERLAEDPPRARVDLLRMDAGRLGFPDDAFDVCVAAYVVSALPEPERALLEMKRVTRPGGRIVLLNHFMSEHAVVGRIDRWISPWCVPMGWRTDLPMGVVLASAGLVPDSVQKVNAFGYWSLVDCRVGAKDPKKEAAAAPGRTAAATFASGR